MGTKQITKKKRERENKIERLSNQVAVREHKDKYANKAIKAQKTKLPSQREVTLKGIPQYKTSNNIHLNDFKIEKGLARKRLIINKGIKSIEDYVDKRCYKPALDEIYKLRELILRLDVSKELEGNIKESLNLLEEICLAYLTEPIDNQMFDGSEDIETGNYIKICTSWRLLKDTRQNKKDYREEKVVDLIPESSNNGIVIYREVLERRIDELLLEKSRATEEYFRERCSEWKNL